LITVIVVLSGMFCLREPIERDCGKMIPSSGSVQPMNVHLHKNALPVSTKRRTPFTNIQCHFFPL